MAFNFLHKKRYIIILNFVLIISVLLFFLSTIAKSWLEKNSMKLIGRKITLKELHFNYLRCSVTAKDFILFEKNETDKFMSFNELYINFEPTRLLSKEYSFSQVNLLNPYIYISYQKLNGKSVFNFDDLMNSGKDEKKDTLKKKEASIVKYVLRNLKITGGFIKYDDKNENSHQQLKQLNLDLPYLSWDSRQTKAGISFLLGKKGNVSIKAALDNQNNNYSLAIKTDNIDIAPFTNYFKPYLDVSLVTGRLFADLKINGYISKPAALIISGNTLLKNTIINDKDKNQVLSASEVMLDFASLDIDKSNYVINKIVVESPDLTAILLKDKSNIEKVLAPYLNDTLATPSKDTVKTKYSVKNISVSNGNIDFNDLTLYRPFKMLIDNFTVSISNLSESSTDVSVSFSMSLNKSASFDGNMVMNMLNLKSIVYNSNIKNLELLSFSPYSEFYISRPVTKGTLNYKCSLKMNSEKLENLNNFKITNLKFGKKLKDKPKYKVPVNLALYIIKDSKGIIDMEIPAEGKPSDPDFKIKKVIWKAIENFLLKAITQPFVSIGKQFGTNPESIKTIPFTFLQDTLDNIQKQKLDKLAEIMLKKQELMFTFSQTTDPLKEQQLIAVNTVKANYIAQKEQLPDMSLAHLKANTLKEDDADFIKYLKLKSPDTTKTIPERCLLIIGSDNANSLLSALLNTRTQLIQNYLFAKNIPKQQLEFKTSDLFNLPQELKTPQFMLDVTMP